MSGTGSRTESTTRQRDPREVPGSKSRSETRVRRVSSQVITEVFRGRGGSGSGVDRLGRCGGWSGSSGPSSRGRRTVADASTRELRLGTSRSRSAERWTVGARGQFSASCALHPFPARRGPCTEFRKETSHTIRPSRFSSSRSTLLSGPDRPRAGSRAST